MTNHKHDTGVNIRVCGNCGKPVKHFLDTECGECRKPLAEPPIAEEIREVLVELIGEADATMGCCTPDKPLSQILTLMGVCKLCGRRDDRITECEDMCYECYVDSL